MSASSIGDDSTFTDLGADSMMRLELVALVEQHVGRELPEQDLPQLSSIAEVVRYVGAAGVS